MGLTIVNAVSCSGMTSLVHGACPHDCPDTCALVTEVVDGRAVSLTGKADHPVTRGWLCAKVRPYLDRVYHPDRLTTPLRRVGPKGDGGWEPITWDAAVGEIAERWRGIIATDGAASILPYSFSGTLGLVQLSVCNQRLWNRMGASGLQRSICGAAAETAVEMTFGARWSPDPADIAHARLIVLWGHNPASTSPHVVPFIREAQRAGAHVVVIDPRRTLTARSADQHLRPRPATDGALALGIMHVLFAEGLHDEDWLEANSLGWRELRERAAGYPPERVAAITGIDRDEIVALARRYGTTTPALLKFADGVQRHGNGGQTARALACLSTITGQVGLRGGGLGYSTGGYVRWDRETVGRASECPPTPRSINMNRLGAALCGEVEGAPIRSLYVFCANPAAASPNTAKIIEGLRREDLFTVVHEQFLTDTADYADLVLPATTQLEQVDLHTAYGHRNLQYNARAIDPPGEARSNWDVMRSLAAAMGYDDPWFDQEPEEIIAEVLDVTARSNPLLAGISLDRLQRDGTVPLAFGEGDATIPFADGHFPTPSGKVELWCEAMAGVGLDPLPHWEAPAEFSAHPIAPDGGLTLISGASHHFVTSSMANQPGLEAKEGSAHVEIHPEDAARRGIIDGAEVTVENARGSCRLRAVVTDDVPVGVVVAPKGRWGKRSGDGRSINWTTPDALADLAGQSTFHDNIVWIRTA